MAQKKAAPTSMPNRPSTIQNKAYQRWERAASGWVELGREGFIRFKPA
jgi:hypothetical protein